MLRRMAGCPMRRENYYRAEIVAGRVGPNQAAPVRILTAHSWVRKHGLKAQVPLSARSPEGGIIEPLDRGFPATRFWFAGTGERWVR